jgi:hypothetical protein
MGWRSLKWIGWIVIAFAILCYIFGGLLIANGDSSFFGAWNIAFVSSFVGIAFYGWGKYGEKKEKTRKGMGAQIEDLLSTTGLPQNEIDTMVEQALKLIDNGASIDGAIDTVRALHKK